jgi:hypothetical protein
MADPDFDPAPSDERPPRRRRLVFVALLALAVLLAGGAVMVLWNSVVVSSLQAQPLSYWQALGLLLLCRILFGGWSRPQRWQPRRPGHRMQQKWASMSPDHRAQFRSHWKARCEQQSPEDPSADRPRAES